MGKKIEKLHKEQSSHNRKHTVYKKMLVCSKKNPKAVYDQIKYNAIWTKGFANNTVQVGCY